ncbi:MAG: hypothetical protein PHS96_10180 [Anaerolineales bacterium]|nr:hypothetical protein [Anaerolineales bacterium]
MIRLFERSTYATGCVAGLLVGETLEGACQRGHQAAARIVGALGALGGWVQ